MIRKYELNPTIEIECPFCGNKHKKEMEIALYHEIECPCGASIKFAVDFEWGEAILEEGVQ